MAKISKSQWDFTGELFPEEELRKVYSVSELTTQVRHTLEKQFGQLWVSGEITNFRLQGSGHIYFTLKDAGAQLSCVLFRNDPVANREALRDGQKVVLRGEMTVYEVRGQYQLHVTEIELHGVGALQAAFEKLKQKLNAEGLFAPERKRPLPRYIHRIGIVTSPTGAAIRDVLHVVERRNRSLEIILVPCAVQGTEAAGEIARAIRLLNQRSERASAKLDLILITRGGGSLEDLWAFNEEIVARAIFSSALPVVSAVGHEIDFTISDFVADLRAATPSAAAEVLTEGVFSTCRWVAQIPDRIRERLRQRFVREINQTQQLSQRLLRAHPRRRLNEKLQHLDDLQTDLSRCIHHDVDQLRDNFQALRERLTRVKPQQLLTQRREVLEHEQRRLGEQARHHLRTLRHHYATLEARLRLLSPEHVLSRGYSITTDAQTGAVVRSASQVRPDQQIKTRVKSGEIRSVVQSESNDEKPF